MSKQLHTRFTTEEVVSILEKYLSKEIDVDIALRLLDIKRRRLFILLKDYKNSPASFTIEYQRKKASNRIDPKIEILLQKKLEKEKRLIEDKNIPIKNFNYSYIQQRLLENKNVKISLPTIIDRAKKMIVIGTNKNVKAMSGKF